MPTSPIVLVTGASEGIGYETTRVLAEAGATVIMHARTQDSGEQAVRQLVKSGVEPLRLSLVVADFTKLTEVVSMARGLSAAYGELDVLVNNATIAGAPDRMLTEDGHEETFQVNYLAPYLLTRSLEHVVRVVNVSSSLHHGGYLNWNDLNRSRRYTRGAAYAQSKLALTMFTKALAGFGYQAVSVHPGVEGADPVAFLCSSKTYVLNGAYYEGRLPAKAALITDDAQAVTRLWRHSARITGIPA